LFRGFGFCSWLVVAFAYFAFWQVLFWSLPKNKFCVKVGQVGGAIFLSKGSGQRAGWLT